MNIPKISALYESSLASGLSASGSSFSVVSGNDRDGNALSGLYGFIIDEGSADEEFVIGTIASSTVTIVCRGIDADAPNTEISANKKAHRRGASVKITDYPIMGILRNIMNGDEALPNPIKYAAGVGPVSADDLVDKAYADALLGGGTLSYDRIVLAGTAGETIASGNLVYLKVSDGRWWLCDADTAATVDNVILGIAQGAGTAGNTIANGVLIAGLASNLTGLTANTKYYASNTAGQVSTTPGTVEVTIGFALSTTSLMLEPRYDQQITEDIQDALDGSTGLPNANNKYITQDNTSVATTDQSQTTQNGTIEVGEANTTTKKNLLAQSFTPAKTKIRSVKLYKSADTGTFTGTVKVALQADSAGSPSGSDLASVTITNADWLGKSVGEFEAVFSSEYASLTVGSLYWIVITPSTSDNSNHPNFGTNTAGGYSSGSAKYKNTTDNWVAISTIDLYFKTIEGINSQIVKTDTSGKISPNFLDYEATGLEFAMGANAATRVKTYRPFQIPMIGTSAAAIAGAWVASSPDVTFLGAICSIQGTGADRCYFDEIFSAFDALGNTSVRFNASNIIVMDYWAILPTSSVDTMLGFCDNASAMALTYNQTAVAAIAFTTNNGTLYAHVSNGATSTTTAIPGITVSALHNYRIVADLGGDTVSFYVDGVLKITISTNFPTSSQGIDGILGRSATGNVFVSNPNLAIKMN